MTLDRNEMNKSRRTCGLNLKDGKENVEIRKLVEVEIISFSTGGGGGQIMVA